MLRALVDVRKGIWIQKFCTTSSLSTQHCLGLVKIMGRRGEERDGRGGKGRAGDTRE